MLKRKNNPPPKLARWATWEEIAGFMTANSPWLFNSSNKPRDFMDAWAEFCGHRLRIRKPMTERTAGRIIRQLEKMGHDRAIESLHYSIDGGYPAVYEPKGQSNTASRPGRVPSPARRGEYPEPPKRPLPRL